MSAQKIKCFCSSGNWCLQSPIFYINYFHKKSLAQHLVVTFVESWSNFKVRLMAVNTQICCYRPLSRPFLCAHASCLTLPRSGLEVVGGEAPCSSIYSIFWLCLLFFLFPLLQICTLSIHVCLRTHLCMCNLIFFCQKPNPDTRILNAWNTFHVMLHSCLPLYLLSLFTSISTPVINIIVSRQRTWSRRPRLIIWRETNLINRFVVCFCCQLLSKM